MSKRIVLLVTSLAVVIGLMAAGTSFAWFTTTTKKKQSISVAVISSVHSAYLADIEAPYHTVIMQGDNLVSLDGKSAMLQLDNKSTTDSQLRISIEYTSYRSGTAQQVKYSATDADDIDVVFAANSWSKNVSANGTSYFYYMGGAYTGPNLQSSNDAYAVSPSIQHIPAISKIAYKDTISDAYQGQPVNVKVVFESKQSDNITWTAIDSYDVSGINQ